MSQAPRTKPASTAAATLDPRSRRMFTAGVVLAVVGLIALATAIWINAHRNAATVPSTLSQPAETAPAQNPDAVLRAVQAADPSVQHTASGLLYKVLTPGQGPHPTDSDVAFVTYVGTLPNGHVFDQSQQPVPMPLAGVVPGFSESLKLMNRGARFRVWLKPSLGYGEQSPGPEIPANSVLIFDIQLVEFMPMAQLQAQMQAAQAGGGNAAAVRGNAQ